MEVTYGLLSSLVQTKSIERILAPIASQISLLIILNESEDAGALQQGDMVPCAQAVMQAANKLTVVAKQQAKLSTDQEFIAQTLSASEVLELASSNLYLSAQRLEANTTSRDARSKLVQASKDVLQGTMKVLLVSDDAEIRRLITATHIVTEKLGILSNVATMPDLVQKFKDFTEALSVMTGVANKRQKDLTRVHQRERIITALNVLKKSVPSLSVALQNSVKYKKNPQAEIGKTYVINEILSAVRDMVEAVRNRTAEEDEIEVEEPGYFVTRIDQALDVLSEEGREELHIDLEMWTEGVIRHSMTVAHLCMDHHRDLIVRTCQRLLQVKGRVIELHSNISHGSEVAKLREDYSDVCEMCIDEFCELEKNVNVALLHLVVDVFKETTEPLERLVKIAIHTGQGPGFLEEGESYITEFEDHAEKICQVANLAAASSTDAKRVRVIRSSVSRLEKLDPEIIPVVTTLARTPQDKVTIRRLKLMMKEWTFELNTLLQVLDEMTDPKMFILVSEKKVEEDINTCNGFILTFDPQGSSQLLLSLIGRSRRVVQVTERVVDNSDDALFRNGLMVYITQLRKAITSVRVACGDVLVDMRNKNLLSTLKRRFNLLQDTLAQVKAGLSEFNHPHVLSPLRRDVRRSAQENKENLVSVAKTSTLEAPAKNLSGNIHANRFIATSVPKLRQLNIVEDQIMPQTAVPQKTELQKSVSVSRIGPPVNPKSHANVLTHDLMNWATKGDKQKVNLLCGDLLGWNNHIVDASQAVVAHCDEPEKKKEIQRTCSDADEVAPRIIDVGKYVLHGDFSQLTELRSQTELWSNKIEQLRAYVDVTVTEWKTVTDKVHQSCKLRKTGLVKQQLDIVRSHLTVISELVSITESLRWESKVKGQEHIVCLMEERNDLENLTVTFITTAEMISQQGLTEELLQLEQLGREWSVKLYSMTCRVDCLGAGLLCLGAERRVWPQDDEKAESREELIQRLQNENVRFKDLLKCACKGEEEKKELWKSLVADMLECTERIKAAILGKKPTTTSTTVAIVTAHYSKLKLDLLSGKWILKAVQCIDLVRQQTSQYSRRLEDLIQSAFSIRSISNDTERDRQLAEFHLELNQLTDSVEAVRKKSLQGIQLSSELSKRSLVRQCLDRVNQALPSTVDMLKSIAEKTDNCDLQELSNQKLLWGARTRFLVTSLQSVSDIKPTVVQEVRKLLGTEGGLSEHSTYLPVKGASLLKPSHNASLSSVPLAPSIVEKAVMGSSFDPVQVDLENLRMENEMDARPSEETLRLSPVEEEIPRPSQRRETTLPNKNLTALLQGARFLQQETERWEDSNNAIVKVAKTMSQQIHDMTLYLKHEGPIADHLQLVHTAKAVAENSRKILKFAVIVSNHSQDERCTVDLRYHCGRLPTVIQQLTIISNVHSGAAESRTADRMLVKNSQDLMKMILQMMKATEAVCMQGLKPASSDADEESAIVLATQWQKKFVSHRLQEIETAEQDDLGLRRVEDISQPKLQQMFETTQ